MVRRIVWSSLALLGLFLLAPLGLAWPLQLVLYLAFGWTTYLREVVPKVTVDGAGTLTALICLTGFAFGVHSFFGWLYRQSSPPEEHSRRWSWRWTAALVLGIVLMFVAGLSAAGIAHQAGWLLTSREPLVASSFDRLLHRIQSSNNVKQIGLGLSNYQDSERSFPPGGTFDAQGRALHSWQTAILPFTDDAKLFAEIDRRSPWDAPSNARPFQTRISTYINPAIKERNNGKGYAPSHYAGNVLVLGPKARTLPEITDGTSQTIMAGEVADKFKPWGYPANWRDPAKGINRSPDGFGSPFPGGANILFADGSVHFLKSTIDIRVFQALATPDGGEMTSSDEY
ncbi:DUF1559 family PulG-like putative transporter [Singulisphaera rosea]